MVNAVRVQIVIILILITGAKKIAASEIKPSDISILQEYNPYFLDFSKFAEESVFSKEIQKSKKTIPYFEPKVTPSGLLDFGAGGTTPLPPMPVKVEPANTNSSQIVSNPKPEVTRAPAIIGIDPDAPIASIIQKAIKSSKDNLYPQKQAAEAVHENSAEEKQAINEFFENLENITPEEAQYYKVRDFMGLLRSDIPEQHKLKVIKLFEKYQALDDNFYKKRPISDFYNKNKFKNGIPRTTFSGDHGF